MVDVISKSAELSQKAQQTGTNQYFYEPYSGTLIMSSPEGNVLTQVQGQTISSKTPSQVQIEKQIQGAGGTVSHDVSEQVAVGLQEQTREALSGQQPDEFQITTPEFSATATGGITPNALAGATGSVISKGYEQNVSGQIVPAAQKFKTSTGQEFTATPTGSSASGGFIWETPFGEIVATPDTLEKEIERQLDVNAITQQSQQLLFERGMIEKESNTIPAVLEFALEHPTKGLEYMIGSEILYGNPFDVRGLEKYTQEREAWMESYLRTPLKDRWMFSLSGMVEPVIMVAGGKALSMIPELADNPIISKVLSVPFVKQILTGAGLGITTGMTAIGTIESVESYKAGDPGALGRGVLLAGAGALGTKFVWETGVEPELKELIVVRQTTTGISVSKIQMKSGDEFAGTGQAFYDTKVSGDEVASKVDFSFIGKKVDEKMVVEIGYGDIESKAIEQDLFLRKKAIDLASQTFLSEDLTIKTPNERFLISGFETATKSAEEIMFNDKVVGLSLSEKISENEFETVFRTAGKTKVQDFFSIDKVIDETKLPAEFFSSGGITSELIESGTPGSMDIIKAVNKDVLGMHTKAVIEFVDKSAEPDLNILIPGLTKTDVKIESKEEQNTFNVNFPKNDVMQVESTKEKDLLAPSTGLEITGTFEESGEKQDIFNVSFTGVGTAQSQRQSDLELIETLQITESLTDFGFATPHSDIEIETEPPIIPGGGWDFGFSEEPFKRGKGGGSRNFLNVPSWIAIELNIHGKMPKNLTGLEIRPLPPERKRKR